MEEKVKYQISAGQKEDDKHSEYTQLQIKEQFLKVHYRAIPLILKIKKALPLYVYMCDNITRGNSQWSWWNKNVVPFFREGYLPFAKHQSFIAKDLDLSQSTISRHIELLEQESIIKHLATLKYRGDNTYMKIYSVGTWTDEGNERMEVYYLHSLTF